MRYLSVCSGIEAASVAWHPLGWQAVAFSEIDRFPSAVLAARFPRVPNLGDMNGFHRWKLDPIDVLVGGTPCQSFSVAGLRKGLADPRGNLCLTYLAIAARFCPRWLVWENVPGVLSSGRGRDFGSFLGALAKLGYGFAYRILDAQYCGVPQRRRRVFVVGHLGDWRHSAAVLFEPESLCGNPPPGPLAKQETARTLRARAQSSHREDSETFVSHALLAKGGSGRLDPSCETFVSCTIQASDGGVSSGMHPVIVHGTQDPCISDNAFALGRNDGQENVLAFSCKDYGSDVGSIAPTLRSMGHDGSHANAGGQVAVVARTLSARYDGSPCADRGPDVIPTQFGVRRLTPRECERLQGFPDDWTKIEYRGKPAADGPRYKAIGNSMAVPVMRWIGDRIARVG